MPFNIPKLQLEKSATVIDCNHIDSSTQYRLWSFPKVSERYCNDSR